MFKNMLKRIQNESRSVQLVARNHECLKALNNVLCVFGRASRCTLRTKSRITH